MNILGIFEDIERVRDVAVALVGSEERRFRELACIAVLQEQVPDHRLADFVQQSASRDLLGSLGAAEVVLTPNGKRLFICVREEFLPAAVKAALEGGIEAIVASMGFPRKRAARYARSMSCGRAALLFSSTRNLTRSALEVFLEHGPIELYQYVRIEPEDYEGATFDAQGLDPDGASISVVQLSPAVDLVIREDNGARFLRTPRAPELEKEIVHHWGEDASRMKLSGPIPLNEYRPPGTPRFVAWLDGDDMDDASWVLTDDVLDGVDAPSARILINAELGDARTSLERGCLVAWNILPQEIKAGTR